MLIQESLEKLRQEVKEMASDALTIFDKSVAMIQSRDASHLPEVREMDKGINDKEMRLDKQCMELLLKEPYALDFRFVFSSIKTIKDLERVGDHSKTIAKWSLKLRTETEDMKNLKEKAREALFTAMDALIHSDPDLAARVMELEFQVDELEDRIIDTTEEIAEAFVAKSLERIGDLATNIAENVIFCVNAQDVRHGGYHKS